jgi:hypothetical protein
MLQDVSFFGRYIIWHYTRAFAELAVTGVNLIRFVGHFFSFGTMVRTFASPWKRMAESYPSIIDIGPFLEVFIVNTLMRIFGMVARTGLILLGLLALLVSSVLYLLAFVVWALVPALLALMIVFGVELLIS